MRAVIYDFKGEYVEKFFEPSRDYILNPLDQRGADWNIFNDVSSLPDLSAITGSLIPPSSGEERFWNTAADAVLRGIMAALWVQGKRTNRDLWQAVTLPIEAMAELLKTTEAGAAGHSYIQDASSKQASSVIAVLMSYVSWLEFAGAGGTFSVRQWLADDSDSFLFLTGRPEVENTLRPYTSLFIDLLGKRFLSLPDGQPPIYFILDEFGNMQKLPTVKRLLTAGGSKGATVIIGIQDFAAIEKIYGREDAKTIYNSCGTNLILNVGDPATAKTFSERFGQRQYWDTSETISMGPSDNRDGLNLVRQKHLEDLILPSEILNLSKRTGYLKIPEHNPSLVQIPIAAINQHKGEHPAFIVKPGYSLDDLERRDQDLAASVPFMGEKQPSEQPDPPPSQASTSTTPLMDDQEYTM